MKTYKIILTIILTLILSSCGGGSGSSSPNETVTLFNDGEKHFLENLFKTKYLYKNEISTKISSLNYNDYDNAQDMINEYKYTTLDKWSYSQTFKEFEEQSTQITSGFGCYFKGKKIKKIRIDSPCDQAGLKRGDYLKSINNISNLTYSKYKEFENNLNIQVTFNINRYDYQNDVVLDINISITPKQYTYKVSKYKILTTNNQEHKVAHFIYDSFSARSVEEIDKAFTYFKEQNVEDIIIDLRYNGGGSLNTASYFLDKLVINQDNNLQFIAKFNNENTQENFSRYFQTQNNSINFTNIIFLTTSGTASASELLINSLKPYNGNVVLIGTKTTGKPVGMRLEHLGDKLIYWLINFSLYNANDVGEYYEGLEPTCEVDDEIFHSRDDINDNLLKNALYYIDNKNCK